MSETQANERAALQVHLTAKIKNYLAGLGPFGRVFVHGGLGSLWNPYPQLAAFEGDHELVTYSLAGNGNSAVRPTQSLAGHVSDLRHLLDELQIEQPIVHGIVQKPAAGQRPPLIRGQ
jgi:pimeloyl-ACP methyl ester carboxylesterase